MHIKTAVSLLALTAALASCGNKAGSLTGTWKVVGVELKPDSLVQPGMFDQESMKKVRFKFGADSSVTISDGGNSTETGRYSIEKTGSENFLVIRSSADKAPNPEMPAPPMEQRMRIVQQSAGKLDLEQKFEPYTFTTHLEPVR